MSSDAQKPLTPSEFEDLKTQLYNAKLTDTQIIDLAFLLKDKLDATTG